ncbi:uracil-DNA glycosylase family protein [Cupriavidus sp. AU9028]|uniref:uracil-DNA glycosylase n=1 Tax=Cupriavidus sp. AU9028 TaxID=2871157 RepID=UPI001C97F5A6|nr:uracil-DNA glycosylase [Cupriavidus sp. AU9028]MBY4898021.1 uracil-DNA glycosylase [Cupriavidus sp. AU9028]
MNRRALFLEALGISTEWAPRRAAAVVPADPADAGSSLAGVPQGEAAADAGAVAQSPSGQGGMPTAEAGVATAPVPGPVSPPVAETAVLEMPFELLANSAGNVAELDWNALRERVAGCPACRLCETRTQTVFGVGDPQAEWMLVGEAPGENEDLQGEPFVGQAGKLLDNMLRALDLSRERNVFIANVLKCRPPGNRNPEPDEVGQCEPYLRRQIALIRPRLIVVLGRFAAQTLLRTDTPIGKLRGTVHRYEGIPVVVTYHPAYLLRAPADKARAWEDLCLAREVHRDAGAAH